MTSMPVKHNLFEDLKLTREEVDTRRKSDDRLSKLLNDYDAVDAEVLKAESAAAPDDQVKKLKEKRLLAKDRIVQQLEYPGTQGAGNGFDKA